MNVQGFAAWCDRNGCLKESVRDELGLLDTVGSGDPLRVICDPMSRRKFDRLVAAAQQDGAVFDWQLNVKGRDGLHQLHFAASAVEGGVLLLGTRTREATSALYEDLVRINNEQATTLREALNSLAKLKRAAASEPVELDFEAFARLNNELVNVQRELQKRNAELARLNEQKNQFLGMAAHDLRNPLGVVAGLSRLLLAGKMGELSPKQTKVVDKMGHSSRFMLSLVEDLLDISKIESGRVELSLSDVHIGELLQHVVSLHEAHAQSKSISIVLDKGEMSEVEVLLDAEKMQQVLSNLVSNAIKYSPQGTTVRLHASQSADQLHIEVADSGQGIPQDELADLFEPFQRTSVKPTGGERSTGLGLTIVNRIVRAHSGRISVTSEVGVGTRFKLELPIPEGEPGA